MKNVIIENIRSSINGLISYAEYIELALYHPTMGYYMRDQVKIGKSGDFITTSNISNIYGTMLAKWFYHQVTNNGIKPAICELGAGNGRFAKAFIDTWKKITNITLKYYIVETSPYHQRLQKELLMEDIIQIKNIVELKPFKGLIFSNELFDALPVHVVEQHDGAQFEIMVGTDGQRLFEQKVILTNQNILSFLKKYPLSLTDGQRIEIPLAMESMLQSISDSLEEGLVVTVDYGYTREEWKHPIHRSGSLRGYYEHKMIEDVLLHPGEMDITSHIHFDWLIEQGEKLSLHFIKKLRQDEFLIATGILKELEENFDPNPFSETSKRNRAIRSLIMPGISSHFHVVIQQKGTKLGEDKIFN